MVLAICLIIWLLFVVLVIQSRKETGKSLQKVCVYLYKKISLLRLPGVRRQQNVQVIHNLVSLHPGETPEHLLTEYHVEKIRMVILILLAGSGIACGAELAGGSESLLAEKGLLNRPTEKQAITLEAEVKNGEGILRENITFDVEAHLLSEEEARRRCQELIRELDVSIIGENPSLQEVRWDLYLPLKVESYPFSIGWKSSAPDLISTEGTVHTEELDVPEEVRLTAEFLYGEWEWTHAWSILLYPPERTEREQLVYDLKRAVKEAEEQQKYEEQVLLPESVNGAAVDWTESADRSGMVILMITVAAAAAVFYMKDKDLEDELAKRRRELKEEYPGIVSKYALFLKAGMTVRGAFTKICMDYYEKNPEGAHPLYEEMRYSCNEMKAGVSEYRVYENFGKRTGVQEYTKLCALLNQNLKKGNTALAGRLREECENARMESLQWRKRQAEEAGTKLLLPMGMMLIMVLVMIILPAFSGLDI